LRYRRASLTGGTFFFTLVTERRRALFQEPASVASVALLLQAVETIRLRHPFEVDAYVVLPDHLHMLWTLPDGDANFSTRCV
jgi:putative transposase